MNTQQIFNNIYDFEEQMKDFIIDYHGIAYVRKDGDLKLCRLYNLTNYGKLIFYEMKLTPLGVLNGFEIFEHVEYLKDPTKNIRIETQAADGYKSEYKKIMVVYLKEVKPRKNLLYLKNYSIMNNLSF